MHDTEQVLQTSSMCNARHLNALAIEIVSDINKLFQHHFGIMLFNNAINLS